MAKLSELQSRVFRLLSKKPNTDVPIQELFLAAYPLDASSTFVRDMQQKLAPLLARINGKLKRGRIEPGQMKRTYRLTIRRRAE